MSMVNGLGSKMLINPTHKTKILPLRWFANLCNHIGTPHLTSMFNLQDYGITSGARWKFHSFIWKWTWAVYSKWGTAYEIVDWKLDEYDI